MTTWASALWMSFLEGGGGLGEEEANVKDTSPADLGSDTEKILE